MIRKATCCCGKCSIEVEGEPLMNAICDCNSCKRRTGSAFGWSAYFPDARVLQKSGDLKAYIVSAAAAPTQRFFCTNCGTTLFWKTDLILDHTGIAAGCFTDAPLEAPSIAAFDERRYAWVGLPAHLLAAP